MLFGHQNDDTNQPDTTALAGADTSVNPLAVDSATGASLPVVPTQSFDPTEPAETASALNQQTVDDPTTTAPVITSLPPVMDPITPDPVSVDAPVDTAPTPVEEVTPNLTERPEAPAAPTGSDDLLNLKQQALTQLSPLVSQLDQTPEEKFRTTMMMIQSTDNQALIKDAYDAAQQIPDEKVRAQALLDVVNEINYFTQPKS